MPAHKNVVAANTVIANAAAFGKSAVELSEDWRRRAEASGARMIEETCEMCGDVFKRRAGRRKHHCPTCKRNRVTSNMDAMVNKTGPEYEKWRQRTLASMQALR